MASELTPEIISTQRQQIDQFLEQVRFVYPLQFESGDDAFPYFCGGTCFAAKYSGRLFIITAEHCIKGREGDPAIAGPNGTIFPLRQSFTPACEENDSAWSDLLMFTTYAREHWPMLESAHAWDVDNHIEKHIWADASSFLVILGYPASLTEVQVEPYKLIREPSFHIGFYGGQTNDRNCHCFTVLHSTIESLDGISGSPVLKIDLDEDGRPTPTLLGVVTQANKDIIRFVGVDVVLRMLRKAIVSSHEEERIPAAKPTL